MALQGVNASDIIALPVCSPITCSLTGGTAEVRIDSSASSNYRRGRDRDRVSALLVLIVQTLIALSIIIPRYGIYFSNKFIRRLNETRHSHRRLNKFLLITLSNLREIKSHTKQDKKRAEEGESVIKIVFDLIASF